MADFQAFLLITLLTWAAVSVSGTTPKLSTTTGDTVNIPCLFGEGTLLYILWFYNDGTGPKNILKLDKEDLTIAPEYADRARLHDDYSTLILKEITVADEGTFHCVVHRLGQTAVPNFTTKLNVFSLRPDTLPVISPCIWVGESSSCRVHDKQSFTCTCTLPNVYPVKDTELIWYKDRKQFSSIHDATQNYDGTTDISRQIKILETGNFTCNATYLSANGGENTAVAVEACIIQPADVPNTPGENRTCSPIAWKTTCIVLLVGISMTIIAISLYFLKARGQRSSRKDRNKSDDTQICREATELRWVSVENGFKDENVTSTEESTLLGASEENDSQNDNVDSSAPLPSSTVKRRNVMRPTDSPDVTDVHLLRISKELPPDNFSDVYVALGIQSSIAHGILAQNDYRQTYMQLLQLWKRRSHRTWADLDQVLVESESGGLRSTYKQ